MANLIELTPSKTYATQSNAVKAVEARYVGTQLRYFIQQHTDGRFFPVFIGECAVQAMVHRHFNVVA